MPRINIGGERVRVKRRQTLSTVGGKMLVKAREATPRHEKNCEVCSQPMLVAEGQIAKYHAACRKLRNKYPYVLTETFKEK